MLMGWHMNEQVERALIRLLDELCMWERETGRGSRLILVPTQQDEKTVYTVDGKPLADYSNALLFSQLDFMKTLIEGAKSHV